MKRWFQRKNIFIQLLIIGWSSISLIVLPSFLIMTYFLNRTERAGRIHTMTDGIIIQMLNARIAEKNFVLHDLQNEKFYNTGLSNNLRMHQRFTENAYEKIEHLIALRPAVDRNSAERLKQLVKEYSSTFTELVDTYRKIGFKDWGLLGQWRQAIHEAERLMTQMNRRDMQKSLLQFNKVTEKMGILVDQIMAESKSDYESAKLYFRLMSLVIYLVGIAVGSMFYYFFARSVSMKLISLKNGVLRVGRGQLDTKVPVATRDEIGIVAEAFNKMTADLKEITVSKNYVDKIIESMADMLIVINPEGKIEKVNRAALDLLGYKEEELIGNKVRVILDGAKADPVFIDEIIRIKSVRNFATNLVGKDAQRIPVSISGSLIPDGSGVVCLAQDNSERKLAEEMLRKSEKELRLLSSRILEAQEIERKRVARELHDGIGQALTGIKFALENGARRLKESGSASHFKALDDIVPLIQATVDETRRIAMGLRPSTLDDIGISETIYWFCQQFENIYKNIRILKLIEVEENQIPETLKTVIFRVLQESLNNVAKHSGADRVQLSLQQQGNAVKLIVEDNGSGFDPENSLPQNTTERRFGLANMKERTELSGGNFTVHSTPGIATRICAVWPTTPG